MHIDLNSCFATIEQQANPFLRRKPIAVAAYETPKGCVLAPSVEAKKFGVKTGMRVMEAKLLCPKIIIMGSDVQKYRNIHLALKKLLCEFTSSVSPKSIDEFVLDFSDFSNPKLDLVEIAEEIKKRIRSDIGDFLSVSIGISTNRFLSKLASNLQKPDGLTLLDEKNYRNIFDKLSLSDLPGIKARNTRRLNLAGIYSVLDFYEASPPKLKIAFQSVFSYYWHLRLHGFEIDDFESIRKSVGNSYALPRRLLNNHQIYPIVSKLTQKTGFRLRRASFVARGVHVAISFRDRTFWHKGKLFDEDFYASEDIYKKAIYLIGKCPQTKQVRDISVSVFALSKRSFLQLNIFSSEEKKYARIKAADQANKRWGNFSVVPARMLILEKGSMPDRIAFGGVKEIEEIVFGDN